MSKISNGVLYKILQHHNLGLSQVKIGKILNLHHTTISYGLKEAGTDSREFKSLMDKVHDLMEIDDREAIIDHGIPEGSDIASLLAQLLTEYARNGCKVPKAKIRGSKIMK